MACLTSQYIHLTGDTRMTAHVVGDTYWIALEEQVAIFFRDENDVHEMMGALEQLSALMADSLR